MKFQNKNRIVDVHTPFKEKDRASSDTKMDDLRLFY